MKERKRETDGSSSESQKACYKRISQSITDHRSQKERERERASKEGRRVGTKREVKKACQRTITVVFRWLCDKQQRLRDREKKREKDRLRKKERKKERQKERDKE